MFHFRGKTGTTFKVSVCYDKYRVGVECSAAKARFIIKLDCFMLKLSQNNDQANCQS